jgi:hypothetical protein
MVRNSRVTVDSALGCQSLLLSMLNVPRRRFPVKPPSPRAAVPFAGLALAQAHALGAVRRRRVVPWATHRAPYARSASSIGQYRAQICPATGPGRRTESRLLD